MSQIVVFLVFDFVDEEFGKDYFVFGMVRVWQWQEVIGEQFLFVDFFGVQFGQFFLVGVGWQFYLDFFLQWFVVCYVGVFGWFVVEIVMLFEKCFVGLFD